MERIAYLWTNQLNGPTIYCVFKPSRDAPLRCLVDGCEVLLNGASSRCIRRLDLLPPQTMIVSWTPRSSDARFIPTSVGVWVVLLQHGPGVAEAGSSTAAKSSSFFARAPCQRMPNDATACTAHVSQSTVDPRCCSFIAPYIDEYLCLVRRIRSCFQESNRRSSAGIATRPRSWKLASESQQLQVREKGGAETDVLLDDSFAAAVLCLAHKVLPFLNSTLRNDEQRLK